VDDDLVEVMSDLSAAEAEEVVLLLAAMGIAAISRGGVVSRAAAEPSVEAEPRPPAATRGGAVPQVDTRGAANRRDVAVFAAREDAPRAGRVLAEEFPEGRPVARPLRPPPAQPAPRAPGGRFAAAALLVVMVLAFASLHLRGTDATRADFLRHGAIAFTQLSQGELWRYATAIFVHFDALHLLANATVFLIVALPLADLVGPVRFLAIFLATGLAGNVASSVLSPSLALKGGASGAIAGVLGALAGQQLRPDRRSRFRRWQVLGALAAVYALLVGTGPGHDDIAHLGGLLSGIVLGRLVPPYHAAPAGTSPPR
jgi:rhomboid protease GluP